MKRDWFFLETPIYSNFFAIVSLKNLTEELGSMTKTKGFSILMLVLKVVSKMGTLESLNKVSGTL